MTKQEAIIVFKSEVLPFIKEKYERDGRRDVPARSEAWNDFTDALCKDGKITLHQYETWTHPRIVEWR